jgi:hypothetical protein
MLSLAHPVHGMVGPLVPLGHMTVPISAKSHSFSFTSWTSCVESGRRRGHPIVLMSSTIVDNEGGSRCFLVFIICCCRSQPSLPSLLQNKSHWETTSPTSPLPRYGTTPRLERHPLVTVRRFAQLRGFLQRRTVLKTRFIWVSGSYRYGPPGIFGFIVKLPTTQ